MTDGELQSTYAWYSKLAERVALLIIIGLLVEIGAAIYLHKPLDETLLTITANVLIVAGVWGEILLEKRAKEASDSLVALANARAAEANQKAQEAALELAELERAITPRVIRNDGVAKVIEALKPFPGVPFWLHADPAAEYAFVNRLIATLQKAGWKWLGYATDLGTLPMGDTGEPEPELGATNASGVQIRINGAKSDAWREPCQALATALAEALGMGVAVVVDPPDSRDRSADAVHVEIDRKL
jgi:hypothetical protein